MATWLKEQGIPVTVIAVRVKAPQLHTPLARRRDAPPCMAPPVATC
jgi:hypothetical protein